MRRSIFDEALEDDRLIQLTEKQKLWNLIEVLEIEIIQLKDRIKQLEKVNSNGNV
jgi:hypothetical protein